MKISEFFRPARQAKPEEEGSIPPEPEFFDEPKGAQKAFGALNVLFEKKWVRVLGILILAMVVLVIFFPKPKSKPAKVSQTLQETRGLVTTESMERAINSSAKIQKPRTRPQTESKDSKKKHKLDSSIAVFLEKSRKRESNAAPKTNPKDWAKLGISSGTKIPALLRDRVFSFNVAAPVTASVEKDFLIKDKIVIPKGSRFLGEASVVKSVDRINVRFDLLILPDGREIRIKALALSEDGANGIKGKVDKHTDTKVLKAIGETLLAGASLFVGAKGADPYSMQDELRINLADNLTSAAGRDLANVKVDKSITVEGTVPIWVMLLEAV